jgi:GT2 family glycosyltransferase
VLSVVIPALNNAQDLDRQLAAVLDQGHDGDWELIVADNGSTDDTPAVFASWVERSPRLRWVDASERKGPAAARNIGSAAARGDRLLFTDADDLVGPGWLDACARALDALDVVVGAVDFTSLNPLPERGAQDPSPAHLRFLPAGIGTNLAVRRPAFEAIGGFAEELCVGEDIDLCWRMQLAGYRLGYEPSAVVAKRDRPTLRATLRQAVSYGRSEVTLYTRFRSAGMRRSVWQSVRSFGWLAANGRLLFDPTGRREWLRVVGIRAGRLAGSVEHRTLYI